MKLSLEAIHINIITVVLFTPVCTTELQLVWIQLPKSSISQQPLVVYALRLLVSTMSQEGRSDADPLLISARGESHGRVLKTRHLVCGARVQTTVSDVI